MHDQVERFLDSIQSERHFADNTVAAYRNDLTQLAAFVQDPPEDEAECSPISDWSDLTEEHLIAYLVHLGHRDYASSTVARKTAAMKSFASWLVSEGITSEDAGAHVTSPRVDKYLPKAITPDDVERLLEEPTRNAGSKPDAIRDRAMLEILYATGMRVSELVSLNVDDVDLDSGTVVCAGRSGRVRTLPLSNRAVDALAQYLNDARRLMANQDTDSLFVNHRGSRLTRQGFWLILKSYAARVGIGQMTPHTLRHSFAVHALRRGLDIKDVQKQLGHVSLSTTQVYWHMAQQPD
jgi:integrase/recombinase XerD